MSFAAAAAAAAAAAVPVAATGSVSACVLVLSFVDVTTFSTAAAAAAVAPATAVVGSAATAAETAAVAFAATAAVAPTGSVLSLDDVTTSSTDAFRSLWLLEVHLLKRFKHFGIIGQKTAHLYRWVLGFVFEVFDEGFHSAGEAILCLCISVGYSLPQNCGCCFVLIQET